MGDSLKNEVFKNVKCKISKIDLNSDYRTFEVEALELRKKPFYFREDFLEIKNKFPNHFSTIVPIDTELIIPKKSPDGEDWGDKQIQILTSDIENATHPSFSLSFQTLQDNNIDIQFKR